MNLSVLMNKLPYLTTSDTGVKLERELRGEWSSATIALCELQA